MNLLSKFTKGFLAVAMFGALSAAAFTEGEDYVKLEKPLPVEQNTLVKVFSYACPFCYKYDKGRRKGRGAKIRAVSFKNQRRIRRARK